MASAVQVSVEEYLRTSYRPDRELIDGELRKRNVGKWEHSRLQVLLASWFRSCEAQWNILTATEQRVRVAGSRIRIPDLIAVRAGAQPDVTIDPPLLVVEILSPDDSYSDTPERAEDYFAMGVSTVLIIDPKTRTGRMCNREAWVSSSRLEAVGSPIYVDLQEVFAYLDQSKARQEGAR
jgi:Uma2 family endonuclease